MDRKNGGVTIAIFAHSLARIASSASGVLIGIFLATVANTSPEIDAGLLGMLGAVSFAAELVFSIPFGVLSDGVSPRWLIAGGALLSAAALQLFVMTRQIPVFYLSRTLEGMGVAAITPPLLAYLADATSHDRKLRARAMSFFELSLLAGLALGGLAASELWLHFRHDAFGLLAILYGACALLAIAGVRTSGAARDGHALSGLWQAMRDRSIRSLAPVWLCVNAVVGLWLGPTLPFLLTHRSHGSQYLDGIFSATPADVGWTMLVYAIVFGAGVTGWGFLLPRMDIRTAMRISLLAMLPVCLGLFAINHSGGMTAELRWFVTALTALLVMIESGFTPAALFWLAQSLGTQSGKGAAMGIYSVLLSVGAIGGSLLAAALGRPFAIDGLLLGTVGLGISGLLLLHRLNSSGRESDEHA